MSNPDQKLNIVCFSNQLWDFENWTNKKHVMSRLMKAGHHVIFVDPTINTGFVFFRHILRGNWSLKRVLTQVKTINKASVIFTPLNLIPFAGITSLFHVIKLKFLMVAHLNKKLPTVLWVYNVELPYLKRYLNLLKYDLLIYDCVDNYPAFPRYDTPKKKSRIVEVEKYLSEHANLVFGTAPGLVEKLSKYNAGTYYTPNVGDYEAFKDAKKYKYQIPDDLKIILEPRIGFIGAVDPYKFDFELMKKIAADHPKYSFVIIGPVGLKDRETSAEKLGLAEFKNIYYLGSRPYSEKVKYMAGFSAEIIPYVLNEYTIDGCFPVKFHDSLAAGLPVVVTNLPAYAPFKDVCYISKDYDEFSENIKKAIEEDSLSKINKRKDVAKENSWDNKVKYMLKLVNGALESKLK